MVSSPLVPFIPVIRHCLLLLVRNQLYITLIDTGSDVSFIDISVVQSLSLQTRPSTSFITFASQSRYQPSFGLTNPITTIPVIVTHQLSYGTSLRPHAFEVLDLDEDEYQLVTRHMTILITSITLHSRWTSYWSW